MRTSFNLLRSFYYLQLASNMLRAARDSCFNLLRSFYYLQPRDDTASIPCSLFQSPTEFLLLATMALMSVTEDIRCFNLLRSFYYLQP